MLGRIYGKHDVVSSHQNGVSVNCLPIVVEENYTPALCLCLYLSCLSR